MPRAECIRCEYWKELRETTLQLDRFGNYSKTGFCKTTKDLTLASRTCDARKLDRNGQWVSAFTSRIFDN